MLEISVLFSMLSSINVYNTSKQMYNIYKFIILIHNNHDFIFFDKRITYIIYSRFMTLRLFLFDLAGSISGRIHHDQRHDDGFSGEKANGRVCICMHTSSAGIFIPENSVGVSVGEIAGNQHLFLLLSIFAKYRGHRQNDIVWLNKYVNTRLFKIIAYLVRLVNFNFFLIRKRYGYHSH